jgi:hypothetical protein
MHEELVGAEPFLCLEVNSLSGFNNLAKKFDILFPNRLIRLVHDGKYTPYFYIGKNKWLFKAADQKDINFSCQIMLDEETLDFLSDDQIMFFEFLNIPLHEMNVIRNAVLKNKKYEGMFFSDGRIHIFDQYLMLDVKEFIENIMCYFESDVVIDTLNEDETGVIVIKTKQNILGQK